MYSGLIKLYFIEDNWNNFKHGHTVHLKDARKKYLNSEGNVDFDKIEARWGYLKTVKESLANKHFTPEVSKKIRTLPAEDQHRILDIMMGGL